MRCIDCRQACTARETDDGVSGDEPGSASKSQAKQADSGAGIRTATVSNLWGRLKHMIDEGAIGTPQYCLIELWRKPTGREQADGGTTSTVLVTDP